MVKTEGWHPVSTPRAITPEKEEQSISPMSTTSRRADKKKVIMYNIEGG
jgi:hypothetical protein